MNDTEGDLAFLPLGGTGEIGLNPNLYRCEGRWLAIDCGLGFGGAEHPEVDIMVPDPAFIADRRDQLVGLVITHVHEDHIGAVAWLWPQLRCPVYCTPLAAAVLRRKLSEAQLLPLVPIRIIPPGGAFDLPPFSLRFIRVAHSTPEAQALVIRTSAGTVLHTGDWKLDPGSADRPAHGRSRARRARQRGCARHDLRLHKRDGGGAFRQRGRGPP